MARKTTRRGNNEGCISQRKNGTWAGVITTGYDENKKQIRKFLYAKTKTDIINKMQNYTHKMAIMDCENIKNKTFGEMFKEYMLNFKIAEISSRTFENQYRNAKLHIIDKIGNMKIDEVNSLVIQKILNNMIETHSFDTVKKVKTLFNGFFQYAISNNLCLTNPTTQTKISLNKKRDQGLTKKYKALPENIRQEFLDKLENNQFLKYLCYIQMFSGLRIGETLALKWKDIKTENNKNTLDIIRGETYKVEFDNDGNVTQRTKIISNTKTAGAERTIPLNDISYKILQEYYEIRKNLSNELNINLVDDESYIFGNDDETFRSYNSVKKRLQRFLKSNNLEQYNIHFHALRQTFSNMLFELEINPKIIQELLGHKDVSTTLKNYISTDSGILSTAVCKLDNLYDSQKGCL